MNTYVAKSLAVILFLFIGALVASQCGAKYNTTKIKDKHAGDEYVYGVDSSKAE